MVVDKNLNRAKVKIGIIARSLGLRNGGVYRYVFNILRQLDQKAQEGGLEIYILHNEPELQRCFPYCKNIYLPGPHSYGHRLAFDYIASFYYLNPLNLEYVIYPKNIIPLTHYLLRCKKIPIIHDLGHFEQKLRAYKVGDTLYARALMKSSCVKAYKILTVSNSTKRDLIERFHIPSQKIHVAYHGIEDTFRKVETNESVMQKFHLRLPYLFYNGSITPRKNLLRMLEAFHDVKDRIPHTFYITGSLKWRTEDIQTYIREKLADRVSILGYLEEEELVALYNRADIFLYPSLYEGFGRPILEAQACGCPVLTSNVTSCPEVAGDGAHIVNPYSVEEMKAGILKILHHAEYRQRLIKRGFENIQRFSWEKTTENILAVCQ